MLNQVSVFICSPGSLKSKLCVRQTDVFTLYDAEKYFDLRKWFQWQIYVNFVMLCKMQLNEGIQYSVNCVVHVNIIQAKLITFL